MVNIATGLATLEPELEDVLRVLGAKRWDVLIKVGLPRSMPYFYGSAEGGHHAGLRRHHGVGDDGRQRRHRLPADQRRQLSMQMGLAFAGLVVVGVMAMAMYELFSVIEKRTTGWAHRGSQGH